MNICHSPSSSAPAKPMKASQKCARMRRLLLNTIESPPCRRELLEAGLVDDFHLRPHAFMAVAAEFMAGHVALAGLREARVDGRDVARDEHEVDGGVVDQEAVH